MDTGKFIGLLVFALVGVLVVMAFVPMIQETTSATDTFENEGYFYLEEYSGDNIEYSAFWNHANPKQITVNDEVIPLDYTDNVNVSVVLDGDYFLRYQPNTSGGALSLYYSSYGLVHATVNDGTDMTVTYSDGVMTVSNGTTTREITTNYFYSIASEGPYVMKKANTPVYMNEDSIIYGAGRTSVGTDIVGTLVSGTLDDVDITIWRGSATARDVTINKSVVNGYNDLYKFDSVVFVVDDTLEDNPTTTQTITYSYVVVPASVTAEKSIHPDSTLSTIINLLPFIAVIGLFVFLVGEFLYTRYL